MSCNHRRENEAFEAEAERLWVQCREEMRARGRWPPTSAHLGTDMQRRRDNTAARARQRLPRTQEELDRIEQARRIAELRQMVGLDPGSAVYENTGYLKGLSAKEKAAALTASEKANRRAWRHLKLLLNDDEKYNMLRGGESIILKGSLGGRYVIYPNGHVIRLAKNAPITGRISKSTSMPYPDVLSTVCVWIMHDEKRFLKSWGCGNMSVQNHTQEESANDAAVRRVDKIRSPLAFYATIICFAALPLVLVAIFGWEIGSSPIFKNTTNSTVAKAATTAVANQISPLLTANMSALLNASIPIVIAAVVVMFILTRINTLINRR